MTDRELMQMALDALEYPGPSWPDSRQAIAEALRARLAQPEPWVKTYSGGKPNYTQPIEQEPFEYWNAVEGWVKIDEVRQHFDTAGCGTIYKTAGEDRVPLYAAPPKREWVGLTDELFNAVLADTEALEDAKMTLEVIKKTQPDVYDEIIDSSIALIDKALSNSIMSTIANILDDENWYLKEKNT